MKPKLLRTALTIAKYCFCSISALCIFSSLIMANSTSAQNINDVKISLDVSNARLEVVFEAIESKTDFTFLYQKQILENRAMLNLQVDNESLGSTLLEIAGKTGLSFKQINLTIAVQEAKPSLQE